MILLVFSFGKAFYAVDNRDNSTEATTTYGPALFVGTNNGYVRRFRNNNGTGTPIQLAGNTWYLISFYYGPGISRDHFVANAYVDGKTHSSRLSMHCTRRSNIRISDPWDVETHLHRHLTENTLMDKSQK